MKTLLVLRHAHAVGVTSFTADADRPLSPRGEAEAMSVAQHVARIVPPPTVILASAALRAQKTAGAIRDILPRTRLILEDDLYGADLATWMLKLQALPPTVETALVVGHNPGLELLVEGLTGAVVGLAPATLVHLEIPVEDWSDLQADGPAIQVKTLHPDV